MLYRERLLRLLAGKRASYTSELLKATYLWRGLWLFLCLQFEAKYVIIQNEKDNINMFYFTFYY